GKVVLLGVVGQSGTVAYISPALTIDETFADRAAAGRAPGKRFRFAGRCRRHECAQWTGSQCGLIDSLIDPRDRGEVPVLDAPLPRCTIRATCRWFEQRGPRACQICPLVVYDGREEDAYADTADRAATAGSC